VGRGRDGWEGEKGRESEGTGGGGANARREGKGETR